MIIVTNTFESRQALHPLPSSSFPTLSPYQTHIDTDTTAKYRISKSFPLDPLARILSPVISSTPTFMISSPRGVAYVTISFSRTLHILTPRPCREVIHETLSLARLHMNLRMSTNLGKRVTPLNTNKTISLFGTMRMEQMLRETPPLHPKLRRPQASPIQGTCLKDTVPTLSLLSAPWAGSAQVLDPCLPPNHLLSRPHLEIIICLHWLPAHAPL
jgi:hypothetical protein